MRGLYSSKTKIRQQIFTEVARFAYEGGDYSKFESLPYKIIPGEISTYSALPWDLSCCRQMNKRLFRQALKKV